MQLIEALEPRLALVTFLFGVVYLGLGLAMKHSPPGNSLAAFKKGTSFLNGKVFVYLLPSFGFMISFYIARRRTDNELLNFALFNAWRSSNSLCFSAELCHLTIQINTPAGFRRSFLMASMYLLVAVAVLIPGLWSYVTAERQWLWLFMSANAAVTLVVTFSHISLDRQYPKHIYFTLPLLIIVVGVGIAAAAVPPQVVPELQQIQHCCQSMVSLVIIGIARLKVVITTNKDSKAAREGACQPRRVVSAHTQSPPDNNSTTCLGRQGESDVVYELNPIRSRENSLKHPATVQSLV